jgi:hypothetical protein
MLGGCPPDDLFLGSDTGWLAANVPLDETGPFQASNRFTENGSHLTRWQMAGLIIQFRNARLPDS